MTRHSATIVLLLLLVRLGPGWAAEPPWPHQDSPFPPDPAVRFGRLDNGLRYALMRNEQPASKLSLRLRIAAGSLQEEDAERGLAHYLEHLAFNGSEHFPPGTLVERLQALGIGFGVHSNAHTSFEETVYKLDLPDTEPETVGTAFLVLSDVAARLSLLPEEVADERGIILAERRDREGPGIRIWRELLPALYPGRLIGHRLPIGTLETLQQIDALMMRAWYEEWYRPERMLFTAVGAMDPAELEALVHDHFQSLRNPESAPTAPPAGSLQTGDGLDVRVVHEPEADATVLRYAMVQPWTTAADTPQRRSLEAALDLAADVFQRRMSDRAEAADSPILGAGMYSATDYGLRTTTVACRVKEDRVLAATSELEQAWRRLRLHGPSAAELELARIDRITGLEQAADTAALRENGDLATLLYEDTVQRRVVQSPQQALTTWRPLLEAVTPADVRAALDRVDAGHRLLALTGRSDLGADARERLHDAWRSAAGQPVAPPQEETPADWAYDELPAPVPPDQIDELPHDITRLAYGNGVVVHLLPRDSKPNQVIVQALLHLPPGVHEPGLRGFTARVYQAGGLGAHDAAALRRALAGIRTRVVGPVFQENGALFQATATSDELPAALQQLRAWLTDPAWRSEPVGRERAAWLEELAARRQDLAARLQEELEFHLTAGLPQRRGATLPEAARLGLDDARAWFEPLRQRAPLELAIVGDLPAQGLRVMLDRCLGSLPPRDPVPVTPALNAPDALAAVPPIPGGERRITVPAQEPRAIIALVWPTDDQGDIRRTRRIGMLARTLDERLRQRIREELGEAYSPHAGSDASTVYEGWGFLRAIVSVAPEVVDRILPVLTDGIRRLREEGVDPELYRAVAAPVLQSLDAYRDRNTYWASQVALQATSQPERLDWAADMLADHDAITAAEVGAMAATYLQADRRFTLIAISPDPAAETAAQDDQPTTREQPARAEPGAAANDPEDQLDDAP